MKNSHNYLLKARNILNLGLCLLFIAITFAAQANALVHPGLSHKKSDLDRMKYQVQAKIEPYYSSYLDLCSKNTASYNYTVQGDLTKTVVYRDSPRTNLSIFESDSRAAYYNALRYYIEGDERYAKKAVECLNAWTGLTYVQFSGTAALTSNVVIIMLEAAELIKSTYSGWTAAEIKKFSDMLVYPGYSNTTIPSNLSTYGTWYWRAYKFDPIRAGNQELCGIRTTMAIGVFMDDERIYDRAWRYINKLPGRTDDIPFPKGPHVRTAVSDSNQYRIAYNVTELSTESNFYGNGALTNYVYENGQCQESSRDQAHTSFGLGVLCAIAEYAWSQGDDLYSAENSRILKGIEYSGRYNVSYLKSYTDQLTPWEPTVASGEFMIKDDATLRNKSLSICPFIDNCDSCLTRGEYVSQDTWELPIGHYVGRGLKTSDEVKWTIRVRDEYKELSGKYETGPTGGAYVGFGGLSFRRPEGCFGDPIQGFDTKGQPEYKLPLVLDTIQAENYDYTFVSADGRTYHDLTTNNTIGKYRLSEAVDIDTCSTGGYAVSNIENGEWLTYTVEVPIAGKYDININYSAAAAGAKIKFALANADITTEVAVPFAVTNSNGINNYTDFTVAEGVSLTTGVQSLKIYFSGVSNVMNLNSIVFQRQASASARIEAENYTSMSGIQTETTKDVDGNLNVGWINNDDWCMYGYVDLTDMESLMVRVASSYADANIEVRLDGVTGALIGSVLVSKTGGTQNWVTKQIDITKSTGLHDVYLVFKGGTGYLFNLNWLEFSKEKVVSGINKNLIENSVLLKPNPVSDYLQIENADGASIEIFDVQGMLVYSNSKINGAQTIDVRTLKKGVCFARINTPGQIITEKFLKL